MDWRRLGLGKHPRGWQVEIRRESNSAGLAIRGQFGIHQSGRNRERNHCPSRGDIEVHRVTQPNQHQRQKNHGTIRTVSLGHRRALPHLACKLDLTLSPFDRIGSQFRWGSRELGSDGASPQPFTGQLEMRGRVGELNPPVALRSHAGWPRHRRQPSPAPTSEAEQPVFWGSERPA